MDPISAVNAGVGGAGVISDVISMINAGKRARQQHERSKELMMIQKENQMALNDKQAQQSKEMWDYSNYENQVKHMEAAGLNKGLMYGGMSGGGGATASGTSAGSAGTAQGAEEKPVMMSQSTGNLAMINNQNQLTEAQVRMNDAQANKFNAEADEIRGQKKDNTMADTALKQMQTANQQILNEIGGRTTEAKILEIQANANKAIGEAKQSLVKGGIAEETRQSQIQQIKNEAVASLVEIKLKEMQVDLGNEQIKNMIEQIRIGKFNANTNAEYQGMDKVKGAEINKLIYWAKEKIGLDGEIEKQRKIK